MKVKVSDQSREMNDAMKNFKVTPFQVVSSRLDRATQKTILALDKKSERVIKDNLLPIKKTI